MGVEGSTVYRMLQYGCLKASSQTPLTSMRIMELFDTEGGFPKGVDNVITCSRVEADILLTDERVKAVTLVGTTGVGQKVYSKAAEHGKRVQSQTEAKNHALVLGDCNLEATVNAIINLQWMRRNSLKLSTIAKVV